jgi:hypothetical protein
MRLSLSVVLLVASVALAGDDPEPKNKKTAAREIKVDGLPAGLGQVIELRSKGEVVERFGDAKVAEGAIKQVNLSKEFLVYFSWTGSGADRLELKENKGVVIFRRIRGETKDRKRHARLFALPHKTEYRATGD